MQQDGFRVNWARLNNELFGMICADPALRARYEAADSNEAQEICGDLFDLLVNDVTDFIERFAIRAQPEPAPVEARPRRAPARKSRAKRNPG